MKLNFPIEKLEQFMVLLNSIENKPADYLYEYEILKVRIRVTHRYTKNLHSTGGSFYDAKGVYCFIDADGNLLFPATWNTPTKSSPIRGSILSDNPLKGLKWSSLPYLR